MKKIIPFVALTFFSVLLLNNAVAQNTISGQHFEVSDNMLVRISAPTITPNTLEGYLQNINLLAMRIATERGYLTIPINAIQKLEIQRSETYATHGTLIGFAVGGLTTGILSLTSKGQCMPIKIYCSDALSPIDGIILGSLAGGLIGLTVGSKFKRTYWDSVNWKITTSASLIEEIQLEPSTSFLGLRLNMTLQTDR